VRKKGFRAPEGKDKRLAHEWKRPRPVPPNRVARPFTIIVPHDEVRVRPALEKGGEIVWVQPPPEGQSLHFDLVYTPAGVVVTGHPGARSMGTQLVGVVDLENGEQVYVTALARPINDELRDHIQKLRGTRIVDGAGKLIEKTAILSFGTEPNRDAKDDTEVGTFLDVTRD
jgi:hypothetical protein